MGKESYFQRALSDFVFDVACGGAIRHLAGLGYTSGQIADRLSFPVSYERVREAVTRFFLEEGVLLCREPAQGAARKKYVYVQEHGEYGRTSFRRIPVQEEQDAPQGGGPGQRGAVGPWTEQTVTCGELAGFLKRFGADGAEKAYVSCAFDKNSAALDERQREYLAGICWEVPFADGRPGYHLLNARMAGIIVRLCENNLFCGKVYLMSARKIFHVTENTGGDRTEEM